jgi:hypothetical protein
LNFLRREKPHAASSADNATAPTRPKQKGRNAEGLGIKRKAIWLDEGESGSQPNN